MQSFLRHFRAIEQSQQLMKCRQVLDRLLRHCSGVGLLAAPLLLAQPALAEGSYQIGLNQPLFEYDARNGLLTSIDRPIYVNSVSPGEVINVSLCGSTITDDVRVEIYRHAGSLTNYQGSFPAGTLVSSQALTSGNVSCTDTFNAPLTSPIRYTATAPGTYEVRLYNTSVANGTLRRFDITVTPDAVTNPDPRLTQGRIWSYNWGFNAGSFAQTAATNTDYFVVVPGGYPGTSVVWKLDLNNFAGFVYEIMANDTGVNSPNTAGKIVAGLSVPFSGNAITPRFQQYLSFPNLPIVPPPQPSTITNLLFTDNAGVDSTISPGATAGIQDSGFFKFTTDTDGTYAVVIDTSSSTGGAPDGIYGAGDVFLLGRTIAGVENVVPWNGRDNNGNLLPIGSYNAQVQSRLGEYHFLAGDAETSGGTAKGLSIYRASSNLTQANTLMYWDDITGLPGVSGGTTTLPNGLLSSDANGHKWGDFTGTSFGNERFLDTYVYAFDTTATALATIASNDIPLQISGKVWDDANGNLAQDGSEPIVDGSVVAPLYANLIDSSGNVIETASVTSTGTYKLTNVRLNTTYTVQLSTTIGVVGQPKPATTLPNGWANTGENKAGTTETITPGEIIVTISGGVLSQDFGIEQLPNTTDLNPVSQANPGGTVTIQVPTLAGTDPEDGALGSGKSFRIVTLPTNGALTYNNIVVTAGQIISNYDPTLLKLDPDDGAITVSFTYAAIDAAGQVDSTPATVTMPFTAPVITNPNLLLVKRITAINGGATTSGGDNLALYKDEPTNPYDDNTLDNPAPTPVDTDKWPNLTTLLVGGINGGTIRPGDELEYTIYFLSSGDTPAKSVLFCDRIPNNVTFLPTAFNSFGDEATGGLPGSDRGILWQQTGATESLTNVSDGDAAQYFPPGADPTVVYSKVNCGGANTNGAVVVNLGNLPNATSPGIPAGSYGFVRFRGKVK
ncbi:hypothetical protein [Phormidesmis sp. 146-33]